VTNGKRVYEHYEPAGKGAGLLPLVRDARVLEVGFGSGQLLAALAQLGNDVYGVDAGRDIVDKARAQGFVNVHHVDVSEESLPFDSDYFDAVYCYEVFEHLANPHRLFVEIRRVLKRGHRLFFSVPAQEVDMGYGAHRHTFVYPGLLERRNLERFLMQMYFRIEMSVEPGPHDYLVGHNFVLVNLKGPGKPDVLEVITGDYSVRALYEDVLSPETLRAEVSRELGDYMRMLEHFAALGDRDVFAGILSYVMTNYPRDYDFYVELGRRLGDAGRLHAAVVVLTALTKLEDLPMRVLMAVRRLLKEVAARRTD